MLATFGCCVSRKKEPPSLLRVDNDDELKGSTGEEMPVEEEEDALSVWRVCSDETHTIFMHVKNGIIVELVQNNKGMVQFRTSQWQMLTIYPEGSTEIPRVQVFDAEHLITEIRHTEGTDPCLIPKEGWHRGNWDAQVSEFGHVLVNNKLVPRQILVMMHLGFCFVGKRGAALLIDEGGVQKLTDDEVRRLLIT